MRDDEIRELRQNIKTLRDIAIKREVEADGPNRWWYLSEYSELYSEKAPAVIFVVVVVGAVVAYNNPGAALETACNWALILGLAFAAIVLVVAAPLLLAWLFLFICHVIGFIVNCIVSFAELFWQGLSSFWGWLTKVN